MKILKETCIQQDIIIASSILQKIIIFFLRHYRMKGNINEVKFLLYYCCCESVFIRNPLLSVPGRQMKRNKLQFNSIQAIALKLAK